jgi:hypothetical protein
VQWGKPEASNSGALKRRGAKTDPHFKLSQHLERCNAIQVLDRRLYQQQRRFLMKRVLPRSVNSFNSSNPILRAFKRKRAFREARAIGVFNKGHYFL